VELRLKYSRQIGVGVVCSSESIERLDFISLLVLASVVKGVNCIAGKEAFLIYAESRAQKSSLISNTGKGYC